MGAITPDYEQLRNPALRNAVKDIVDELFSTTAGHDHDGTNSKSIGPEAVVGNNSVTEAKIAANAVTNSKILDGAVTVGKLAANAVETEKIKDANVTADKLASNAVVEAKIANNAVTNDKLADITRGSIKVGGASNAPTDLDAKSNGYILVGDGTDLKSVAVSGDITLTNAGVTAVGAKKITTAMLGDTASANGKAIADPGTGKAIPVTSSGYVEIAIGDAAQTNTLAVPAVIGQELTIYVVSVAGTGSRTITVASAINQTGNNTILLDAAGETVVLRAIKIGAALAWRVIVADGATLSTAT